MALDKYPKKMRWILLITLSVFSILTAGCEKGSLGAKSSAIHGYVMDAEKNLPIADVAIRCYATVGATSNSISTYKSYMSGGDGSFTIPDLDKGTFTLKWEKFGYTATGSYSFQGGGATTNAQMVLNVSTGETIEAPIMWMDKNKDATKGTLKGYPVDAITGSPLQTFTVSQDSPTRYKTFETSQDFKEAGYQGLEGGNHIYTITCENYRAYSASATISATPCNLGVIRMTPETISISGTLRNLPGYIIDSSGAGAPTMNVWAETAGKVIATGTMQGAGGTANYTLGNIPVTVGAVSVKCKLRGYDIQTISSSVSIPKQRPSGTIAGIDMDFSNVEPIRRDVRVIVRGTAGTGQAGEANYTPPSIDSGEIIRVYIKQGGKDVVPYVDVSGSNLIAEAYFTGVITGYPLDFMALNTARGNVFKEETSKTIPEDGNTAYTFSIQLPTS